MTLPVLDQPGDHAFWYAEVSAPTPARLRTEWSRRTAVRGRETRLYLNQLTEWSSQLVRRWWVHTAFAGMDGVHEDAFVPQVAAPTVASYAELISRYAYPFAAYCLSFRTVAHDRRPPVRGWGQQFKECERNGVPVAIRDYLWRAGEGRPMVLETRERADAVVDPLFRGTEPDVHEGCVRVALLTYAWALEEFGGKVMDALPALDTLARDGDTSSALRAEKSLRLLAPLTHTIAEIRRECGSATDSREEAVEWARRLMDTTPAIQAELEGAADDGVLVEAGESTVEALARLLSTGQQPDQSGISAMFFGRVNGIRRRAADPRKCRGVPADLIGARLRVGREKHTVAAANGRQSATMSPLAPFAHSAEWDVAVDIVSLFSAPEFDAARLSEAIVRRVVALDPPERGRLVGEDVEDSVDLVMTILQAAAEDTI